MTLPLIMVAPNGARRGKADHPALPVTIPELVACAKECFAAGAGGIHAHVRGKAGEHVLDAGLYKELTAELGIVVPEMAVQITTEAVGLYSPAEQRDLVASVQPKMVSVALREITDEANENLTRSFFHECAEAGISVQHILYSAAEVDQLAALIERGTVPKKKLQLLHVLGRYSEGQQSSPTDLSEPLERQKKHRINADWAVCAFGMSETECLLKAMSVGGKARVGFENSIHNADGSVASSNAERVMEICGFLQAK